MLIQPIPMTGHLQIFASQIHHLCTYSSQTCQSLQIKNQYCVDYRIFHLLFIFYTLHLWFLYFTIFIFLLHIKILHLNFTCISFPIYWHMLFFFLNFKFHVLVRLSLFTLTSTRLVSNYSMVTNNTMLFSNTNYIMYGPNHFLVNFPRCKLLPFGNHKT